MPEEELLEVAVDTVDDEVLTDLEDAMPDVKIDRWQSTRDIGTILTLASTSVGLINALLTLKDRLLAHAHPPNVTVKNAERDEVVLLTASREDLERLLSRETTT